MPELLLALDQGTTSSRAIVFRPDGAILSLVQAEHAQVFPRPGWVEHDPEAIWGTQHGVANRALAAAGATAADVAAIGIANQRETVVLWERATGRPVANAIVWQDRRTADVCQRLRASGVEPMVRERTGLVLDPYFSATKLAWLLDNTPGARARAERGELAFGTIDSFLLWRLTGGAVHATDVTNASRTLLLDARTGCWDDDLLALFGVPRAVLPEVRASSDRFGETLPELLGGRVPVTGILGDQQAACFGQACFEPGMVKNTYGTGSFLLMNTGAEPRASANRLLTTVAWGIGAARTYALEGSIFVTGAAVQWLRDELGIVRTAAETEALAGSVPDTGGVYMVPAFVGLGAPYWDSEARGALVGLTRGTGRAHIARAALEAACYQTRDVVDAMQADAGAPLRDLRADGGMAANDLLLRMQADVLGIPVHRPAVTETTALGAACLAGIGAGVYRGIGEVAGRWRAAATFEPRMEESRRAELYAGWRQAVARSRLRSL
ncbi:MAG: glycerol kinase GlpK [Chthonomonadales bacterium]|nr:glycerol kinase GlpK [Chthonomonadales bacterium]